MQFLQNLFERIRGFFTGVWERTERRDKTRFFVITGIAVVLLIGAIVLLNAGRYVDLVKPDDQVTLSSILSVLEQNNIKSKMSSTGYIQVDKNDQTAAYAAIVPQTDSNNVNYATYEKATGLTSTDYDRRMYSRFQMESTLTYQLEAMSIIKSANVMIYLADNSNSIFKNEFTDSTAAVSLTFTDGVTPSKVQIQGLADYIGASCGINPENVTILDGDSKPLNKNWDSDPETQLNVNYEFTREYEKNLEDKIGRLLAMMVGQKHYTLAVNAKLNFDDQSISKVTFEPVIDEEGIVRSVQTVNENARGSAYVNGEPGTDEDGAGDTYAEIDDYGWDEYEKTSNTINYEINEIRETIVPAKGSLEGLTVSVLVDSNNLSEENNDASMIRSVVGGAIGLLEKEFESRVFVNIKPLQSVTEEEAARKTAEEMEKQEKTFQLIQTIVLYVLIALCVVLIIWRTLSLFKPKEVEIPESAGMDALVGDLQEYKVLVEAAQSAQELEIVKTPSRERVEEFIDSNPSAVANMVRTWLADEGEKSW